MKPYSMAKLVVVVALLCLAYLTFNSEDEISTMNRVEGVVIAANIYEEGIANNIQNTSSGLSRRSVTNVVKYVVVYGFENEGVFLTNSFSVLGQSDNWFANLFNSRPSQETLLSWLNEFPAGESIEILFSEQNPNNNMPGFAHKK